jgi:D-alanine-D-alanine ligase
MSARTVAAALNPDKYELVPISIDSEGRWGEGDLETLCDMRVRAPLPRQLPSKPAAPLALDGPFKSLERKGASAALGGVDVLFPLLHGPYGEDGSIQGLARLAGLPCVGSSVLGSALCMDKQAAKRILRDSGIPIAPFRSFRSPVEARLAWPEIEEELGSDLFVKPANLGSSVGVSRVASRLEYERAVALAFEYDLKVLVERTIVGREIEVAVLGNRRLRASLPGEVVPKGSFYSYEAKYLDEDGAEILAPAPLSSDESAACRRLALEACEALCVTGMARVDMFLPEGGEPVANEVNTIPGFTSRSMYPLLWEASGLPLERLVDELLELAILEREEASALRSSPPAIH